MATVLQLADVFSHPFPASIHERLVPRPSHLLTKTQARACAILGVAHLLVIGEKNET